MTDFKLDLWEDRYQPNNWAAHFAAFDERGHCLAVKDIENVSTKTAIGMFAAFRARVLKQFAVGDDYTEEFGTQTELPF